MSFDPKTRSMAVPDSCESPFTIKGDGSPHNSSVSTPRNSFENPDSRKSSISAPSDVESGFFKEVKQVEPVFSVFDLRQKVFLAAMASLGAFFSSVSANIYFPALNPLSEAFHVSPSLINFTVTGYQLCQAVAPLFIGDLADAVGRRPAYMVCFTIYISANIGLALCPNYAYLLFFRCMQSTGSSGTISLASGVVADIIDSSHRGKWSSWTTAGYAIAPALGPVLGGLLAEESGWRSIFWFLAISAAVYITLELFFCPETSRNVVGNGSLEPQRWNRPLAVILSDCVTKRKGADIQTHTANNEKETTTQQNCRKFKFPNPLNSLKLLGEKDLGLLLAFNAVLFGHFYFILTTTPYLFGRIYNFDTLQIGFCYLPIGVMALLAQIFNGSLLNWNFRRIAAKIGWKIDETRKQDLADFPIEKARLQVIMPLVFTSITSNFIYGWVMHFQNAPLPAALVLQGLVGFTNPAAFSAMNCLVTDLFPQKPSTASAANNLLRCFYVAAVTASVLPLVEAIGTGPAFAMGSGVLLVCTPISYVLAKNGPAWRAERAERERQKRAEMM